MNEALYKFAKEYADKKTGGKSKSEQTGGDKVRAFVKERSQNTPVYGKQNTGSASAALTGGDKVRAFAKTRRQNQSQAVSQNPQSTTPSHIPYIGTAQQYTAAKQRNTLSPEASAVRDSFFQKQTAVSESTQENDAYVPGSPKLPQEEIERRHRETFREGNPLYNDDRKDNAYASSRPEKDIEFELASAEKRAQEAHAKLSIYAAQQAERGTADLSSPVYQRLLEEKQSAQARVDALKAEKKDARNARITQGYKDAQAQVEADQKKYFPEESAELDKIIAQFEEQRDQHIAQSERWEAANGEKLASMKAEYAELRKKGYDVPSRLSTAQIPEYNRFLELKKEIAALEKERTDLKKLTDQSTSGMYYASGAKTFSALSEDERQTVLDYIAMLQSGLFSSGATDYTYTSFDGTQKEADYKQTSDTASAYKSLRQRLETRGLSPEEIARMQKTMQALYNERARTAANAQRAKSAAEHPVLSSIGSVFTSLIGGISSGADLLLQNASNALGKGWNAAPIDFNTPATAATAYTDTVRDTVSQKISDGNGAAGQIGAFIYQTGMSGADSLLASFLGNAGGAAVLGLGAAYSAAKDAHERGATDAQAMWTGLFAGVFETLFERVSIGNLNALKETPVATVKDIFLNIAKSAGVNASEEAATEAANLISDYLINGDLSVYSENYYARIAAKESEADARKNALLDMLAQIGLAGVGGALMGVGFAGGAGAYNYTAGRRRNHAAGSLFFNENGKLNDADYSALLTEGLQSENAEIRDYAARLGEKRDGVSQNEAGLLYRMLASENPESNIVQDENGIFYVVDGIFDESIGTKQNPVTKEQFNSYVDYAYLYAEETNERGNTSFPKQKSAVTLGNVSDRAAQEALEGFGIDISGFDHILTDNNIRHIKNSHGERTKEKYPVTKEDIKKIPDIIENFDDILYVPRKDGKAGIFFVKRHNGVTYYLEQIQGDSVLTGKQMIKVPTGTIPAVEGLREAIQKKWGAAPLQMNNVPRMYVQDVWSDALIDSVAQAQGKSQEADENLQGDEMYYNLSEDARTFFGWVMQKNKDAPGVREAFYKAYLRGYTGKTLKTDADSAISESAQRMVYEMGMDDKAAVGTFKPVKGASVSKETEAFLSGAAKDLNCAITYGGKAPVIDGLKINGYITQTGAIHIFEDAEIQLSGGRTVTGTDAAVMITAGHELTHRLQQLAPKEYARFCDMAVQRYGGVWYSQEYANRLGLSETKARDEMAADFAMEKLFTDTAVIEEITKKHSKIAQIFRNILQWIKDKLGMTSDIDTAIRLWNNAYNAAVRNKNADVTEGDVKYSKHFDDSETLSIKQQLREHAQDLRDMEPVASIFSLGKNGISKLKWKEIILSDFKSRGFQVDRQGFGIIEIGEPQIEKSLDYINTDAEYAAFQAVHRVLKRGKEISGHDNHKNRGYSSITFAAPIEINGVRGNMAVIVKQTGKNKYHTHRILMPDGSAFIFQKEIAEATPGRMTAVSDGESLPITSAIDPNISQDTSVVNNNSMQFSENDSDIQNSVTGTADIRERGEREYYAAQAAKQHLMQKEKETLQNRQAFFPNEKYNQQIAETLAKENGLSDSQTYPLYKAISDATEAMRTAYLKRTDAERENAAGKLLDTARIIDAALAPDIVNTLTDMLYDVNTDRQNTVRADEMFYGRTVTTKENAAARVAEIVRSKNNKIAQLRAERDLKLKAQRGKFREKEAKQREARSVRGHRAHIEKKAAALYEWLAKPDKKGHSVPEAVRADVLGFLQNVNLVKGKPNHDGNVTKHDIRWQRHIENIADLFEKSNKGTDLSDDGEAVLHFDYVPDSIIADIKKFAAQNDSVKDVYQMDDAQLAALDELITAIHQLVWKANRLHAEGMNAEISETAERFFAETESIDVYRANWLKNIATYGMADFATYQALMNKTYRTLLYNLRTAADDFFFAIKEVRAAVDRILRENDISDKTIRGWRNEAVTVTLGGADVDLTVPQLMSLYRLSKREQAMRHILDGGIEINRRELRGANLDKAQKERAKAEKLRVIQITEAEIDAAAARLSVKQRKAADDIQAFLSGELAEYGNRVSMKLYGIRLFTEEQYFPIRAASDDISREQSAQTGDSPYAVLNAGMTKSTDARAKNGIVLSDMFGVFTNHVSDMLNYYAYAIPTNDILKFLNYKDYKTNRRVRDVLAQKYGKAAVAFIDNQLIALGKRAGGSAELEQAVQKTVGKTKAAMVGANIQVVVQQESSLLRAMAVMNPKYLRYAHGRASMDLIHQYCGIAYWKSIGFFDTNIGRGLDALLFGYSGIPDALRDKQMALAQRADNRTIQRLWNACEAEIKDTRSDLTPGTEAFYTEVGKRLSVVIDETQVVDSPLHRTQAARSNSDLVKTALAFKSEQQKSYNTLVRALVRGETKSERARNFARAYMASALANLVAGVFKGIWKSIRAGGEDDDDLLDFANRLTENIIIGAADAFNPLSYLPYGDVVIDAFSNSWGKTTRYDTQLLESAVHTIKSVHKAVTDGGSWYDALYNGAQTASYFTGIGAASALRDFTAAVYRLPMMVYHTFDGAASTRDMERALQKRNEARASDAANDLIRSRAKARAVEKYGKDFQSCTNSERKSLIDEAEAFMRNLVKKSIQDDYLDAWKKEDEDEIIAIRRVMMATGLYSKAADANKVFQSIVRSYYKELYKKTRGKQEKDEIIKEAMRAKAVGSVQVFDSYTDTKQYLTE